MTKHTPMPWTWHAKSIDQAHNGSIYYLKHPGHAYAIAMQPKYVDDKQFAADAAFIEPDYGGEGTRGSEWRWLMRGIVSLGLWAFSAFYFFCENAFTGGFLSLF